MTIRAQLREACARAEFTQQDLATWLQYDYVTVQSWCGQRGVTPHPLRRRHIEARLKLLYAVLDAPRSKLPLPPYITQFERKAYIEKVRDHALGGVPKPDYTA